MPIAVPHRANRQDACTDQVIGAILSGWRYDISGIPKDLRGDYEAHLVACSYCKRRQRLEAYSHISAVHVHLHGDGATEFRRIPDSIAISLETVACVGVFVSLLLWVLVAIATPVPGMLTSMFRERRSAAPRDPEDQERLRKQAA